MKAGLLGATTSWLLFAATDAPSGLGPRCRCVEGDHGEDVVHMWQV